MMKLLMHYDADFIAPYDATCVARLREQGASFTGKTNMDEFGMGSASYFSQYGPCKNPFSPANQTDDDTAGTNGEWYVPGGSSGGSAVAVATGSCYAALGSDTGGSVRQPAAFCGVVGFKPTYGAISRWGLIAYASSFDCPGIFTRSVADAALLFDIVAGKDGLDYMCQYEGYSLPKMESILAAPHTGGTKGQVCPPFEFDDEKLYSGKMWSFHPALFNPNYANSDSVILERMELHSAQNDSVGEGKDWGIRSPEEFHWPPAISLEGLRVGIPREFNVEELSESTRNTWLQGMTWLRECGASIYEVSLPHVPVALSAYYILASAEAASNLSRYDGLRYGYNHTSTQSNMSEASFDTLSSISEEAMDELENLDESSLSTGYRDFYRSTRTAGFGQEVQRRIMVGNYVLSENARGEYFDAANEIRSRLKNDFSSCFSEAGVHVLLAPTTPTAPWTLQDTPNIDPVSMYANDVMTVPINLAGLPAMSIPVDLATELPCGLQIIGRPHGEPVMAWVAAALERQAKFSMRSKNYIS